MLQLAKKLTGKVIKRNTSPFELPEPENGRAYRCIEFCKVWGELSKPQRVHAMRKMQEKSEPAPPMGDTCDNTQTANSI